MGDQGYGSPPPRRVRVAQIVERLPPELGGKEVHAAELTAALAGEGVVSKVFFRRGAPPAARAVRLPGRRSQGPASAPASFSAAVVPAVTRAHAQERFDLIHAHGDFAEALAAAFLSRRLGIPAVLSVHGGLSRVAWHDALRLASFSAMQQVFAVSAGVAQEISRIGVSSDVVVRPSAARDAFFDACRGPKHRATLVSVGRLAPVKGYEVLLDAYDRLAGGRDLELCLIADGAGDYADGLRAAALRRPGVRCWAEHDPERLALLVASATVFVLPSLDLRDQREGTPIAVLEALAAGTAVIASDAAGAGELARVGERVSTFPSGDARALAAAIAAVLDAPELTACAPAVSVQTWRQAAAEVAAHYRVAIDLHRRGSVLFAVPWLEVGGAEHLVLSLADAAAKAGRRTLVAGAPGSLVEEVRGAFEYVPLRFGRSPGTLARNSLAFAGAIARARPSAVNCHNLPVGLSARLGAALATIRTRHVLTVHLVERRWHEPIVGLLGPLAFSRVLPVAETVRRDLARYSFPWLRARFRVVHAGIESPAGAPARTPVVGSVARLVRRKGHRCLLHAWSRVTADERSAGWRLELWGDGPELGALERLAATLGIDNTVSFRGTIPGASRQLGSLEIVVLASTREALPLVLVEAMAAGCAIVMSDLPGCRELLGDSGAGEMFAPEDPEGLARALLRLIGDPSGRRELAAGGHARFMAEFTRARMLARYSEDLGVELIG